jgi:FixJ family two-component response regulator
MTDGFATASRLSARYTLLVARKDRVLGEVPVISIIDDDASVRVATSRLVRSLGYAACAFASADEFLGSLQVNTTSCVIADVQMPGMSGVELQELLRAKGSSLPVLFITGFPDERMRARALDAGAICFLTKPFDCATLTRHIEAALRMRRIAAGK